MRRTLLVATSLTLLASTAAHAQAVPVTFGTDPTGAHPRLAQKATYVDVAATSAPAALSFEPEPEPAKPLVVTVAPGDTVYGLARRHGVAPADIIAANGLTPPYALSLGQTLSLPGAKPDSGDLIAAAAVVAPTAPVPPARPATGLLREIERVEDAEESGIAPPAPAASPRRLDAMYAVRQGDTLYSLSRRFEVPLPALAEANGLSAPYALSLGQEIIVPEVVPAPAPAPASTPATDAPAAAPTALAEATAPEAPLATPPAPQQAASAFAWPIRGAIVSGYGSLVDGVRNDGINIAAPAGAPIRAAADGEVVYKGDELAGYGNLLLVKHEDGWVSAYAHTGSILVQKGERVVRGQVVAKVGQSGDVDAPQLHFELRHDLRPQDPVAALNGTATNASYQR